MYNRYRIETDTFSMFHVVVVEMIEIMHLGESENWAKFTKGQ